MVDDIKPHIIGITESWANNDITKLMLNWDWKKKYHFIVHTYVYIYM